MRYADLVNMPCSKGRPYSAVLGDVGLHAHIDPTSFTIESSTKLRDCCIVLSRYIFGNSCEYIIWK